MKKLYFTLLMVSSGIFAQGSLCTDPIVITSLPYSVTDDTANYLDSYDPQTVTNPTCGTTNYGNQYHSGNDVIYAYTAVADGMIKAEIPSAIAWTGMFIYTDCANIGITYAACATGVSAGPRIINNFAVTAGQTYFIYISSWEAPQTVAYTLNVTEVSLGVNQFQQKKSVVVYPNPATNILQIETDFTVNSTAVYNVNGQRLEVKLTDNKIAIDHLQSGFYILELNTNEGKVFKNFIKS